MVRRLKTPADEDEDLIDLISIKAWPSYSYVHVDRPTGLGQTHSSDESELPAGGNEVENSLRFPTNLEGGRREEWRRTTNAPLAVPV